MKNVLKYIGLLGICLFSFYYTEKVALFVKNKHPLMKAINEEKDSKTVLSINSEIIDDIYIIPGLNGKEVNVDKSFNNMKTSENYDEDLLIYNQITPDISLSNNKNKIIIRGNKNKNSVSIVFREDNELAKYMSQNNYKVNILISKEQYKPNYEMINNASNETTYNNIEDYLNKNKINSNLCYIVNNIPKLCNNKYLFKPSLQLNHSNISQNKNKINSGEIILIENSVTLSELKVILEQIDYQSLKVVYLSDLISEIN